jgi:hypothetical protein
VDIFFRLPDFFILRAQAASCLVQGFIKCRYRQNDFPGYGLDLCHYHVAYRHHQQQLDNRHYPVLYQPLLFYLCHLYHF